MLTDVHLDLFSLNFLTYIINVTNKSAQLVSLDDSFLSFLTFSQGLLEEMQDLQMRKVTVFQERLDSLSLSMSVSFTLLSLKNKIFDLDKKKACVSFYYRRHQSEKGKVLLSLPSAFSVLVADFLHLRFAPLPPPPLHLGCWVVHNQMKRWLELPGC